ncbi:dihydrofolate reductase [Aspergillus tanneri]|uniref:Dihydrofolate reductase n=1 Tax=Aspergillus tanneri TaxID=1220188 RepID=A0A5M9NCU7_9EURO|nr:uncharacterized protein ATNIH1004_001321 [Aspergillus tanneri]KAA8652417.1 hypothetical protein ATNIH1004_001321 [Aspergillus tanneri]
MPPNPLTLIVATTPIKTKTTKPAVLSERLGIGHGGALPWPRIKADMSFFARVTTRAPRPDTTNAILMGRKTYDSLPVKLRPLAKRINVVLTRDPINVGRMVRGELENKIASSSISASSGTEQQETQTPTTDAIVETGLETALQTLETKYQGGKLGKIFVIGGAEIYAAALRMAGSRPLRIVMTNVQKINPQEEFECDTFFPVDEELVHERGWRKVMPEELTEWVGETVSCEWKEEGDVRIQMVGYERI